jgi:hypothetical protein
MASVSIKFKRLLFGNSQDRAMLELMGHLE